MAIDYLQPITSPTCFNLYMTHIDGIAPVWNGIIMKKEFFFQLVHYSYIVALNSFNSNQDSFTKIEKVILWRTRKSKWFEQINFVVTQFTSYYNELSQNFTHPECKKHFYPPESSSTTVLDYAYALSPFSLLDLSALFSICSYIFALSLLALFAEIMFSHLSNCKLHVSDSTSSVS